MDAPAEKNLDFFPDASEAKRRALALKIHRKPNPKSAHRAPPTDLV